MNVLIVGLGSIGKKHVDALNKISFVKKIFALRSNTHKLEKYKNVINIYKLEEIEDEIDFTIISTPTFNHSNDIEKLLPLKKPLFIEKPLFSDLNNFEILNKIRENDINTYVACNLRFLNCLKFIKEFITINKVRINEVNSYCGSYLPDWRPDEDYKKSYSSNRKLGGGVDLDLIHEIDYNYWLFGEPNNVFSIKSNKSSIDISAYDYANYVLSYTDFNLSIILNYYRHDRKRTLEIVCDHYTLFVDLINNKVFQNRKLIFRSDQRIIDTYLEQLYFYISNIGKNEIMNSAEEAYKVLKICLT